MATFYKFFYDNNINDLAEIYQEITNLRLELNKIIPQDFSAFDNFSNKENLKHYVDNLIKIS